MKSIETRFILSEKFSGGLVITSFIHAVADKLNLSFKDIQYSIESNRNTLDEHFLAIRQPISEKQIKEIKKMEFLGEFPVKKVCIIYEKTMI